jgi:lipid A ethanolaminephosphotransferase
MPALLIAAIAAIVMMKQGGGSEGLPRQFAQLSVGLVAGVKIAEAKTLQRREVTLVPGQHLADNIVFLVDESVRGDYLDWTPGNPYTPNLPRLKDRVVNFGLATSGGNCSQYSNAILRFAASPHHLTESMRTSPGLFRYAKRAGYRTVFIDAQAGINRNPGLFQNFMTKQEAADIDGYYTFPPDTPTPDLDFKLLEVVQKELATGTPVFIYANKNGAHFPYDNGYPEDRTLFHPTMKEAGFSTPARIGSYRNAVSWSVDMFLNRLFAETDLSKTTLVYTSDHGQVFEEGKLTHCTVAAPDPREGLVPLFAMSGDTSIQSRFANAAAVDFNRSSHFAIAPTLLELMGYDPVDLHGMYTASLFEPITEEPGFTSGDVFGIFSETYHVTPVDRAQRWLESSSDGRLAAKP